MTPKIIVKIVTKKRISNEFLIYVIKMLLSEKLFIKNVLSNDIIIEKSGVIATVDIVKTNKNINQFPLEL
jgi:hypothetical protein